MALSKKKLKYLQRHAGRKSPAEIARELDVPLQEVIAHLNSMPGKAGVSVVAVENRDKILVWMLGGIVLLAPFIVLQDLSNFSDLPKKAFIQLGSMILFGLWLHNLSRLTVVEIRKCFLYLPLGFLILWSLFSITWASDHFSAFTIWIHWAACGLVFFVAFQILDDTGRRNLILGLIFTTATLASLLGLAQQILEVDWVRQIAPPSSTFANRNAASQYIVLNFPLGLIFLLTARRRVVIWAVALSLAFIGSYLFHTFTRAGWLSVSGQVFLFLIYLVYRQFKLNHSLISGGQKMAALAAAFVVFLLLINLSAGGWSWRGHDAFDRLTSLWESDSKTSTTVEEDLSDGDYSSVSTRKTIYRNTLEIIREKPLRGVGLNNFVIYYPKSTLTGWWDKEIGLHRQQANTHNDYLQITSELGIPAVMVLFCFLAALVGRLPVFLSVRLSPEDRDAGCACMIGIAGLCANAVVSFPLYLAMPPFILAIYAAIFFHITEKKDGEDEKKSKWKWGRGKMVFPGIILVAMILALWIFWQYRFYRSELYFNLQSMGLRDRYYKESVHWGLKAHEMNPFRKDVHNYLGRALLKMEEREKAMEHFERFHESYPYATFNLYYMALCYKGLNQFEKAKPLVEMAIEILPDEGRLRDLSGWIYSSLNQPEKGLEEFRLAAQLIPEKSNYHYNHGVTAYILGNYDEAAEALGKSVQLKDDFYSARKFLGLTLVRHLDRPQEGVIHLKEALAMQPTGQDAEMLRNLLQNYEQTPSE